MRAIVRDGDRVELREAARPVRARADEVVLRVMTAGICRTDLRAARGLLGAAPPLSPLIPLILGHEIAGVVEEAGAAAGVTPGTRVAVMPAIPCGSCTVCAAGARAAAGWRVCPRHQLLGVDRDGGFAEFAVVPGAVVHPIPETMSFRQAAFAEPVAASLAVLRTGIGRDERGVVIGHGRIAELTRRVLASAGFDRVQGDAPADARPAGYDRDADFDFAIETMGTSASLAAAIAAVRPGGTLVVKSRPPGPIAFDLMAALRKELTIRAAAWAPLPAALDLLASGRLPVDDLFGDTFPLERFEEAFAAAEATHARKIFLALGPAREPAR